MRASEFLNEDEPFRIKIGGAEAAAKAKAWIEKVYAKYPHTMQNNHVMTWGSGDDQQFAMFELTPSFSKRGAVEVKWIQAYPLRAGVGSRAMQELQAMAREDGISLTLFPWDKGQVSQSKLTKFYKGQGFAPSVKGGKAMQWSPELAEGVESLDYQGNCTEDEVVDEIFGDVNNFARMVEEHGDEFTVGKLVVKYDPETDIHSFYYKKSGVAEGFSNDMSTEDMIAYLRQHHDTNLHQDYLNHVNTFSKFVLKDIPTNTLKTDLPGLDREKVERYKKMDQSKAPPIVLGGKYILDGYHRANAVKELGIPTIKAYVGIPSK